VADLQRTPVRQEALRYRSGTSWGIVGPKKELLRFSGKSWAAPHS